MRILLALCVAFLGSACTTLQDRAQARFGAADLAGTRWGLVVTTMDGRELVAIRPDERFMPASNTKLFTVAAAFERLGDMSIPDPSMGTSVRIEPRESAPPDIVLVGGGDAMLLDAADCQRDCLSDLADMVAANGIDAVGAVIADERLYPHEPVPPGWSQDDLITRSGEPVSALTVNSNEVMLTITPGAMAGDDATVAWRDAPSLFALDADVATVAEVAADEESLIIERAPGSPVVRVHGIVQAGAVALNVAVAVEDPALSAAMRFRILLEARGIRTAGNVEARYRPRRLMPATELPDRGAEIARLLPPPLIEDVTFLMKQSQNLHAELLLHRVGLVDGDGSREAGLEIVEEMLTRAGAPRWAWDLRDGSGMSVYNRVTPRMVAGFLRWTSQQPWGAAYRDTLPVGGVDGTLRRRFAGTSLEGRIFAKTGTLTGVNALSGFMLTKSGKTLVFSAYANDRASVAGSAIAALDATLVEIAEMN